MSQPPHHPPYQPEWLAFEREHLWHPYASMKNPDPLYPVKSASGVMLEFEDGRRVIDGMASWWSAIHGYNVPALNAAVEDQLKKMAHVMFGGLTHEPAVRLAEKLLEITPANMNHIFFSDSGSVSVEVALKMAIQYWQGAGSPEKTRFLCLKHAYHGDTFAAMSLCDPVSGMHHLFTELLTRHHFADVNIEAIRAKLEKHHGEIAAMVIEPMVQNAGGMHFHSAELLKQIRDLCDEFDLLLIVDEIATGFGRTGRMFACEHADIQPDIMCIGKALTGGYMTLAATLCSAKVCDGIHAGEEGSALLMHGPTYMANPLACATALASIELLLNSPWQTRIQTIKKQLEKELAPCRQMQAVADVRVKGAIGVIEMHEPVDVAAVQSQLIEQGVWLRPFGKLIYTMPPYVISRQELSQVTSAMCKVASTPRKP